MNLCHVTHLLFKYVKNLLLKPLMFDEKGNFILSNAQSVICHSQTQRLFTNYVTSFRTSFFHVFVPDLEGKVVMFITIIQCNKLVHLNLSWFSFNEKKNWNFTGIVISTLMWTFAVKLWSLISIWSASVVAFLSGGQSSAQKCFPCLQPCETEKRGLKGLIFSAQFNVVFWHNKENSTEASDDTGEKMGEGVGRASGFRFQWQAQTNYLLYGSASSSSWFQIFPEHHGNEDPLCLTSMAQFLNRILFNFSHVFSFDVK